MPIESRRKTHICRAAYTVIRAVHFHNETHRWRGEVSNEPSTDNDLPAKHDAQLLTANSRPQRGFTPRHFRTHAERALDELSFTVR